MVSAMTPAVSGREVDAAHGGDAEVDQEDVDVERERPEDLRCTRRRATGAARRATAGRAPRRGPGPARGRGSIALSSSVTRTPWRARRRRPRRRPSGRCRRRALTAGGETARGASDGREREDERDEDHGDSRERLERREVVEVDLLRLVDHVGDGDHRDEGRALEQADEGVAKRRDRDPERLREDHVPEARAAGEPECGRGLALAALEARDRGAEDLGGVRGAGDVSAMIAAWSLVNAIPGTIASPK